MFGQNQNVRSDPSPGNPSGLYSDLLAIGNSYVGDGLPNDSNTPGAIQGNTYIDRLTGIEYKLTQSGWEGFVDFTTIGGGGTIPDPLTVNQLNVIASLNSVNLVSTNPSSFVIAHQTPGQNLELSTSAGTGQISTNSDLNMNTNDILGCTKVVTASIDNIGQTLDIMAKVINLTSDGGPGSKVSITNGALDMNNFDINGVRNMTGAGVQDMTVQAGGFFDLILSSQQKGVKVVGTNDDIILQANNTHGISVKNAVSAEFLRLDGNTGAEYKMVLSNPVSSNDLTFKGVGTIEKTGTADMNISHLEPNSNIYLRTAFGSGIVRVQNDGSGNNITLDGLTSTVTTDNLSVTSINNSGSLTAVRTVGVTTGGVIEFRRAARSIVSTISAFGGVGTSYFSLNGTVAPGELWGVNVGVGKRVTSALVRLHYNSPWSFGSVGSAILNIGYVPADFPMTTGSFITLASINIDNGLFYQGGVEDVNIVVPDNACLGARMVLTATSGTSTNAEVSLCVTVE